MHSINNRRIAALVFLTASSAGLNIKVHAQAADKRDEIEEIVVTAEKRAVSVKDIPISIYAVSGQRLADAGVTDVQGLTQLAPSLQFAQGTNTFFMSIRGVGSETTDLGADPGVALSQDGITLVRPQMLNADFLDVERVEVLRGPQGTIAGRNATAGAINVHSNLPTETTAGSVSLTGGSHSSFKSESVISGPLIGNWLLGRLALGTENANGWIRNTYIDPAIGSEPRSEDLNNSARAHARASLLFKPNEFQALLIIDRLVDKSVPQSGMFLGNGRGDGSPDEVTLYNSNNSTNFVHPSPRNLTSQSDIYQSSDTTQTLSSLKLSYDFSPTTSLTSHTGYVERHSTQYLDYDGTAAAISENTPIGFPSRVLSEELTLLTSPIKQFDFIFGGIFLRDESQEPLVFRSAVFGATAPGIVLPNLEQTTKSYAIYAQIRYFVTDALHIDLGGRETRDDKYIDFGPETFNGAPIAPHLTDSASWNAFTPRIAVHYDVSNSLALFASVSKGYKAGGYNALSAPEKYNPEYVTTGEIGSKYQDGATSASVTAFYSRYKDIQENIYLPNAAGVPSAEVTNSSRAKIYGLETEIDRRVTDYLRFFGNLTLLHARLTDAAGVDPTFPELGVQRLDDHRLPRAPNAQAVVGADLKVPIASNLVFIGNGSFHWQSKAYFDIYNDETASQGSFGVLNLRAGFQNQTGDWQASLYADNLFDKRYFSDKENIVLTTSSALGIVGVPRMWGVNIKHRF
jgi:iron complex outermembrane receptor protein